MHSCSGAGAGELGAESATSLSSTRRRIEMRIAQIRKMHEGASTTASSVSSLFKTCKELKHGVWPFIVRRFISEKLVTAKTCQKSSNMRGVYLPARLDCCVRVILL